jgi:hypothetical protein
MNTAQAIQNAFSNLADLSELHYDFWLSELYNCATGEIIESRWDDANLRMMEDDILQLSQLF